MGETVKFVSADAVRLQCAAILKAWGMNEERATLTAELMTETDLRGIDSHGISMLMHYGRLNAAGQLRLAAEPRIVRQHASTALIDAGAGLGHPVAVQAMELAIEKAKNADVGIVSVFNSHHFGAAGLYAEMAAKAKLVGIVSCSARSIGVVPTFGAQPRLGTNPIAMAVPSRRHPTVLLDMSTSVAAINKVKVHALNGKELPIGWVTDTKGKPVTDAASAYEGLLSSEEGGLAPTGGSGMLLGGHKGYGLGLFVHILSSTLGGAAFAPIRNRTRNPGDGDDIGQFFMAINPEAFRPFDAFEEDLDAMLDVMRETRAADPAEPVLIPGDPEWRSREKRLRDGIPIPPTLWDSVDEIASRAGVSFILPSGLIAA